MYWNGCRNARLNAGKAYGNWEAGLLSKVGCHLLHPARLCYAGSCTPSCYCRKGRGASKHTAPCRTRQDFSRGSARALCSAPSRHSRLSCRALQGCFWSRNISPITCYRGISRCHAAGSEFGLSAVLQGFTPNLDCFRLNFGNDSSHRDAARPAHQTVPTRVSTHTYWHIYMHTYMDSETKRQGERERERERENK